MESEYGTCNGNCEYCCLDCATAKTPDDGSDFEFGDDDYFYQCE